MKWETFIPVAPCVREDEWPVSQSLFSVLVTELLLALTRAILTELGTRLLRVYTHQGVLGIFEALSSQKKSRKTLKNMPVYEPVRFGQCLYHVKGNCSIVLWIQALRQRLLFCFSECLVTSNT